MWERFRLRILRSMIDWYITGRNLSDLLVEIDYRAQKIFYEDNLPTREAYYLDEYRKAKAYITQKQQEHT